MVSLARKRYEGILCGECEDGELESVTLYEDEDGDLHEEPE